MTEPGVHAEPTQGPSRVSCVHPGPEQELLFPTVDYLSGESFRILRCRMCGLTRTEPAPTDRISDYYPSSYYGRLGKRRFPGPVEWGQSLLYGTRVRRISRLALTPERRVLDLGCGRGHLLAAFRQRGWSVEGVELSDGAAQYPREALGLKVHVGRLQDLGFQDAAFDAVVLWHVLEHVPEPATLLGEVGRILRPNGLLLVAVPNFGSIEAGWTRGAWFHLDAPRHLVHFTPDTLGRQVAEAGLEILDWSWFAPEYDLFSFIQSFENRLGLPGNLLYRWLRRPGAELGAGAGGRQVFLALALAVPLAVLGFVWTILAGLLRRGSSVTVIARRPGTPGV